MAVQMRGRQFWSHREAKRIYPRMMCNEGGRGELEEVMYANIKMQIFRKGIHQNQLARTLGMDETVLSKIIRGFREPSEAQRKQLADYLEATEQWLFEKSEFSSPSEILSKTELRPEPINDRK
jgi:ribosome-binding protein aMBF1 (putative translation factor)